MKRLIKYLFVGGATVLAGSPVVMNFLERWEGGNQYVVYADQLAGGLPTVCKGITHYTSPYPVVVGERWSKEKCDDVEQLGRDIYAAAIAGEYGPIAPYDGPSEEEILEQEARAKRDGLLRELDAIVSNPLRWNAFTEAEQQALADYRQALLDVPQQEGFPDDIDWPQKPETIAAN